MTAYEIVKAAYPGIPDAILNQYADLLPAEASALSAEFAKTDFFFNAYIQNAPSNIETRFSINYSYNANFELNFLAPQNSQHAETKVYDSPTLYVPYGIGSGPDALWVTYIKPKLSTRYDRRLYSDVVNNINIDTGQSFLIARASAARKNYGGIASIVALYENGVTLPSVDYEKAYSFLTYVNSYKKFSTQVDAEKALLEQQAKNNVDAYRQQLNDQTAREYSDLQSKKIQLLIAIDNEAKSAQRDYQNMLLTAQTLKQQIGGALGN